MNRRNFVRTTGISMAFLAFMQNKGFANFFTEAGYKFRHLRNNVGVFTEQGGTIAWLVNKEGIVVVDSQFPDPAAHLISELKNKSGTPFKYLLNTHHHGDHTSGNVAFKDLAENVVAHTNSLANQKRVAEVQKKEESQLYPDLTFTDTWTQKVGDETINAQYFGPAHTNGDAVIHFQNANIAHMGDLVFNRRFPVIDKSSGASISHWIEVLENVNTVFDQDTLFIFGHAADTENITGSRDDLKLMQNYLDKLLVFVKNEIKSGKTKDQILLAQTIPGVSDYSGKGIERSLSAAYEELILKE